MKSGRLVPVLLFASAILGLGFLFICFQPGLGHPPTATQIGITNVTVGGITAAVSKAAPQDATFFQEWLRTGSNVVLFQVLNRDKFPIWLSPNATIETKGSAPTTYLTFLADAVGTEGVYLDPGETVTFQLLELPAQGLSRATFSYSRVATWNSMPAKLRRWWDELLGHHTKKAREENHLFYSDWFTQ